MQKHEWRKKEKHFYQPKAKPEVVTVPAFKFVTISGEGNPNSPQFSECIGALYAVSYAIKMTLKKAEEKPAGYCDWTVYPLEGVWDLNEEAKQKYDGTFNKDDLVFKIMIRQPDFIEEAFFIKMLALAKAKKPNPYLGKVKFEGMEDGRCIQMLHIGSYDDEPASFQQMEEFAASEGLERLSKTHREIYLSDFRKVAPEKLKTILRFKIG
ncbi:MAG: GyrI-like domain-containing protein [Bacteroidota bacterium]